MLSACVHIDPKLITSYILMKLSQNITLVIIYYLHDDGKDISVREIHGYSYYQ